jgi:hypothetical protein
MVGFLSCFLVRFSGEWVKAKTTAKAPFENNLIDVEAAGQIATDLLYQHG